MIFPLEELITCEENMYELTCAAIRRAFQLSKVEDEEIEENAGKVIQLAARQVFTGEVSYSLQELPSAAR